MRQHQLLQTHTHTHNRHFHKMSKNSSPHLAFPEFPIASWLVLLHIVASFFAAIFGGIDFSQFSKKDDEVKVTDGIIDGFAIISLIVLLVALFVKNNFQYVTAFRLVLIHIIASTLASGASTYRVTTKPTDDPMELFLESFPFISLVVLIITGFAHHRKM